MKKRVLPAAAVVFWFLFSPVFTPALEKAPDKSPSAFLPEKRVVFSPVVEGFRIKHDFILINKGTGPLNIEKVKTG